MFKNLLRLFKYRALIRGLAARELKARYRGSALGFLWSFVNPLLLLLIYTFVFTVVMPGTHPPEYEPYALFMFCGILPWAWFSASLLESSNSLIAGGHLIRKVLFPAEVLPITTVIANLLHFGLGLPILGAFLLYSGSPLVTSDLVWLPVVILVQLILTLGLALGLAALTAHFRDMKDLLANLMTVWFFATPIIYPISQAPESVRSFLSLNPFTHLARAYQDVLFVPGPYTAWPRLLELGGASILVFLAGYFLFDRLRDTFPEAV